MPRIKITEYRAKKLLLGDSYRGVSICTDTLTQAGKPAKLPKSGLPFVAASFAEAATKAKLAKKGRFVIKVDQGVKQRMKKGLVILDQKPAEVSRAISKLKKKGFSQFLAEPFFKHRPETERYLSLERVREGIRLMYARAGGINIESRPDIIETHIICDSSEVETVAEETGLPGDFLKHVFSVFEKNFFSFLEINPLVVANGRAEPLDAAVLVDSAGAFFAGDTRLRGQAWTENDLVYEKHSNAAEKKIDELAKTSPASFKLTVLNPNGSLFFLLSGGGGSIVIADEAELRGFGGKIGNYGEYSGGPTREETYLYSKEVIGLLLKSKARRKALIIAGGVANFTDVRETFLGIIDALAENAAALRKAGVKVFVRRGGPNEKEGLALMKEFIKKEKLLGAVYGSDAVITKAVDEAIKFVK